jgi:tRNA (cytidine/uridine-2'-O-)-methyltransferase
MEIILFEPEIPPNTGNVARLCAGLGLTLNLIQPLGFSLEDKHLKRAGLDYWPYVKLSLWPDFAAFQKSYSGGPLIATSAQKGSHFSSWRPNGLEGLIFGPETRGLPQHILDKADQVLHIPLNPEVRSLNLATTVGFFLGAALCQIERNNREGC